MTRLSKVNSAQGIKKAHFGALLAVGLGGIASSSWAQDSRVPLHNHANRLISFETANMNPAGAVDFYIGTSQTDRRSTGGTGNQLYFGGGSYSPSDKLAFGFDLQTYQDPVANPINGAYPDMKMHVGALWGKYQLYKSDSVSLATLVSIENMFALDSQLFGGRSENIFIGSLKAPITYKASPEWQFHLTPSVTVMPDTVKGTQFYGTIASVGAGFSYKPSQRLSFFGAVEAPISGSNNISSTGTFTKQAVWTAGGRYNVTPKAALEAYITNGAGMSPATSVLTHWPDGDVPMLGMRLIYTPGAKLPESYRGVPLPVSTRQATLQHDGFTLGTADTLEPGMMRADAWYGSDNNAGLAFSFSPDRDGEIQFILEQYSDNPTAQANLVPTTELRYMIGPKLRFMDQNNGNAFSLSARVLFGRQIDSSTSGVGVFFGEFLASYKANNRMVFTAAPKLAAFGGTDIAGLGLGVNYAVSDNMQLIAEVTPVGLDASTATWAAGVRYNVGKSGFAIDAQATNAIGRYGIGAVVAQDDPRFSLTLSKVFDLRRAKFY